MATAMSHYDEVTAELRAVAMRAQTRTAEHGTTEWFDLPTPEGFLRVVGYPQDGHRFEVFALTPNEVQLWSATFANAPAAVVLATVERACGVEL